MYIQEFLFVGAILTSKEDIETMEVGCLRNLEGLLIWGILNFDGERTGHNVC